ncbi:uncharacterized protein ACR2FA_009538 [Aphomia sociella]
MESIQQSLEQMKELFDTKMAAFQQDLHEASTAPVTLPALVSDFNNFKMFVTATFNNLALQVQLIAQKQDQLEMRSRRKILLLHGVKEGDVSNSTTDAIKVFTETLKIPISATNISRSHRMGHREGGKARPILVKFCSIVDRDKVWFNKTGLKNSGITLSEFLTKERHDAFMAARKHFGVSKCWTRDGSIVVQGNDGRRIRVNTSAEVNCLVNKSPISSTTTITAEPLATAPQSRRLLDAAGITRSKRDKKK